MQLIDDIIISFYIGLKFKFVIIIIVIIIIGNKYHLPLR